MKLRESNAILAAANPVGSGRVDALPLGEVEESLIAAIVSERPGVHYPGLDEGPSRRRHYGRYAVALGVAAGAAAALLIGIGSSGGSTGQPASAYGAELVRFANTSPLILLEAPSWHVEDVIESTKTEGEIDFLHGDAPMPEENVTVIDGEAHGMLPVGTRERRAQLNWYGPYPGTSEDTVEKLFLAKVKDRANSAEVSTTAPVLDTTARVFQYEGGEPGARDITALWVEDGLVLEFRSLVPDMATFEERLAALRKVDPDAWLSALPRSIIKTVDHGPVVAEMLKGIPLPPGFTAADIPDEGLTNNRYQVGAEVAGAVACTWFAQWAEARQGGDPEKVQQAIDAMATAKEWPLFAEMSKRGAYPQIVEELAADMPKGTAWRPSMPRSAWRPLTEDVESAFGCSRRGIPL